ncbi:peptidase, partial [bacterium]|nr:peptidase [bacterium]
MTPLFRKTILLAAFCLLIPFSAWVEEQYPADVPEPGSSEAIARDTTDPKYISSWVKSVPESKTVPSPSDFLGHIAGAAGELVSAKKIHAYMRELDKASDRVFTEVIGQTEEGREILLVAISDEKGIANLNAYKEGSAKLADPRKTSPEQAEQIIPNIKPFYYLNCAVHADEDLSPDMSLELAYRLAVSNDPMIRRIRENLVVLINPVANVDGREKMV